MGRAAPTPASAGISVIGARLVGRPLDELLGRLAAVLRHERHLSAELSHELRTPLARVAAQVELMTDGADADQRRELREIRANCAAMDGIIDTLMAAARRELTGVVGRSSVATALQPFSDPHGVPRVTVEAEDVPVGVEQSLVTRILAPVIDNARRYAASSITVSAARHGGVVEIEVSNDGPRLDPGLSDQVFQPGYTSRDAGHDGVGLGLALARRLALSADGELVVDPSRARTTFRLTLPAG